MVTALLAAAFAGNASIALALLEHGASIGHCAKDGAHALSSAAQQGDVATIRVLLEHGADVNMPGNLHKASPVLLASQGCHSEAVRELVAAGADPDLRDANGASALDYTDKTLRRRKKKKEIDDRRAAQLRQEIEAALASAHGARARSDTGSLVPTTHQCSK